MNREEFMAKLKSAVRGYSGRRKEKKPCSTMKTILMMQEQTTRQK